MSPHQHAAPSPGSATSPSIASPAPSCDVRVRIEHGDLSSLRTDDLPAGLFDRESDDDMRVRLRLVDAGRFRLVRDTIRGAGADPIETGSPAIGVELLCALLLDDRRFKLGVDLLGVDPSARAYLTEGAGLAKSQGQHLAVFRASMALAMHALSCDEVPGAERHLGVARETAAGMGFAPGDAAACLVLIQALTRSGQRDRALAVAGALAARLAGSDALVAHGSRVATVLGQLGDPAAACALLRRLRDGLRHARNAHGLAHAESARALVAAAAPADSGAMRHHVRAGRLWLLQGDTHAAARESAALAQAALARPEPNGRTDRFRSAMALARTDLEAVPPGELLEVRARLAQTEGHALFLAGDRIRSSERFAQARDLFAALGDWGQVGFVEGLRGTVGLQDGYVGGIDGFRTADEAFSRAAGLLRAVQPEAADAMLLFTATARFELACRSDGPVDRQGWIDRACEPLLACWTGLARRTADNPLSFDLRSNVALDGGTLRRRVAGLLGRLEEMSMQLPDGTLPRMRAVVGLCGLSDAAGPLH